MEMSRQRFDRWAFASQLRLNGLNVQLTGENRAVEVYCKHPLCRHRIIAVKPIEFPMDLFMLQSWTDYVYAQVKLHEQRECRYTLLTERQGFEPDFVEHKL